jgi:hypothetical protein
VDGTGSGSCPVAGSNINDAETRVYSTGEIVGVQLVRVTHVCVNWWSVVLAVWAIGQYYQMVYLITLSATETVKRLCQEVGWALYVVALIMMGGG